MTNIFGSDGGERNANITVNADLKVAMLKGFRKYNNKKGEKVILVSSGNMYKAGENASGYDKVVLLKAKRIVKLLKQSIAAHKLTADVTLSKEYERDRGAYNT